ncbi:hypothetical protein CL176_03370 [Suicoccus acidiformans]|uniref:Uncharacterized protein n=1 Tax=Suicoccus acidiformans TaxID=2036206 RepID=A0A347WJ88_9LACT|nr:hypothetical protein CL176_03370 [Suicoccus acidiformans]
MNTVSWGCYSKYFEKNLSGNDWFEQEKARQFQNKCFIFLRCFLLGKIGKASIHIYFESFFEYNGRVYKQQGMLEKRRKL